MKTVFTFTQRVGDAIQKYALMAALAALGVVAFCSDAAAQVTLPSPASKPDVVGTIEAAGEEVSTYIVAALGLIALLMAIGVGISWMRRGVRAR